MKRTTITQSLLCTMLASMITSQADATWFSWFTNYFNQPSKNALIATTAFASLSCIAALTCTWGWWKTNIALQAEKYEQGLELAKTKQALKDRTTTAAALLKESEDKDQQHLEGLNKLTTDLNDTRQAGKKIEIGYAKVVKENDELRQSKEQSRKAWSDQNVENRNEIRRLKAHIAALEETGHPHCTVLQNELRQRITALEMENETVTNKYRAVSRHVTPPVSPNGDLSE